MTVLFPLWGGGVKLCFVQTEMQLVFVKIGLGCQKQLNLHQETKSKKSDLRCLGEGAMSGKKTDLK